MKKLIPGMLALLILLCSCNAKKSFLHQRYTNFKHQKQATMAENRSHADRKSKTSATSVPKISVPEAVVVDPVTEQVKPKLKYTKSVINKVILPVVLKGKEKVSGLITSNSKIPTTKLTKTKPLNLDQKQEKRGLLWGLIDAILAIILLCVFVTLVVWLIYALRWY